MTRSRTRLSDELFLGTAAVVRGSVVGVDSAGEGEVSAQGVGSLNRGAVREGVDVGDRGIGGGDRGD